HLDAAATDGDRVAGGPQGDGGSGLGALLEHLELGRQVLLLVEARWDHLGLPEQLVVRRDQGFERAEGARLRERDRRQQQLPPDRMRRAAELDLAGNVERRAGIELDEAEGDRDQREGHDADRGAEEQTPHASLPRPRSGGRLSSRARLAAEITSGAVRTPTTLPSRVTTTGPLAIADMRGTTGWSASTDGSPAMGRAAVPATVRARWSADSRRMSSMVSTPDGPCPSPTSRDSRRWSR